MIKSLFILFLLGATSSALLYPPFRKVTFRSTRLLGSTKQQTPSGDVTTVSLTKEGASSPSESASKWAKMEVASRAAAKEYDDEERRKVLIAIGSASLGAGAWLAKRIAALSGVAGFEDPVQLLHRLEDASSPLEDALRSGKPTVIDFYADWCENCKEMAPALLKFEEEYQGRVNFVSLNADRPDGFNDELVFLFRVDGIPHLALVDPSGNVQTALVGLVPDEVLRADLDALVSGKSQKANGEDLPFLGFDAFETGRREGRDRNVLNSPLFSRPR